jgi:fatty-acyl-CoA synthase
MFRPETDWIKKWAHYTPNKMMLRDHHRNLEWTYSEFDQRCSALAAYLRSEYNIQIGERVVVFSKNQAEHVFLFFALMKLGAILVTMNYRYMPLELDIMVNDSDPVLFFYEEEYEHRVKEMKSLAKVRGKLALESLATFLENPITTDLFITEERYDEEDMVMILYTAGTTGTPKGAMITRKMLFWNSLNTSLRLDLNSQDHTQSYAPFCHTGGWNVLLTPLIHHGASQTLLSKFEPDLILELMEKEKTTLFFGVPTMLQMMGDSPLFEKANLSSVRYAIVGGAPMPVPLINKWNEKGVFIRQGYGLTEVGPNCFSLHHDDAIRKRGSIGSPNFYLDAKIINESGKECGAEEVGELWLSSPVVTPGYWNRPEATKESIVDGWFKTGDMVRKDVDEFYYVVDRIKNLYISGGSNVYPAEVEKFLLTNPAVKEVAILGVPDDKWGEVGRAFLVLNDGYETSEVEIKEFCNGKIAKYKTPRDIIFLESLPTNEAGKIDKLKLKEVQQ